MTLSLLFLNFPVSLFVSLQVFSLPHLDIFFFLPNSFHYNKPFLSLSLSLARAYLLPGKPALHHHSLFSLGLSGPRCLAHPVFPGLFIIDRN